MSLMSFSTAFAGQGSGGGLLRSKESFEELKINPSELIKMPGDTLRWFYSTQSKSSSSPVIKNIPANPKQQKASNRLMSRD